MAILAAGVLSLAVLVTQSTAQQGGTAAPRQPGAAPQVNLAGRTVLIDVNRIFKNHARFNAQMKQLKNEADGQDAEMKKKEVNLRNMSRGLQEYNPGGPEYKKLEEQIARASTEWKLEVQNKRREYMQREAKIYNDTYNEVQSEVNYFCQSQGIALVLRFTSDPVDESNPESILSALNKQVVWSNPNLDITDFILQRFAAPKTADTRSAPGQSGANYQAPRNNAPPAFPGR
jgi:Skp family chaperone for outer membrane proteins